MPEIRDFY